MFGITVLLQFLYNFGGGGGREFENLMPSIRNRSEYANMHVRMRRANTRTQLIFQCLQTHMTSYTISELFSMPVGHIRDK